MLIRKHLDAAEVKNIIKVKNMLIATLFIPEAWKIGRVIPIVKLRIMQNKKNIAYCQSKK